MEQLTLLKFLMREGLLRSDDNRIAEMKKLTTEDREWFKTRAAIELGVEIVQPQ